MNSLGRLDILRMQREGWRFPDHAVRVGNGWLFLAVDPSGNYDCQLVADPDQEPDKWRDDNGPRSEGAQLQLLLESQA
jgi:hypothetical protein